MPLKTTLNYSPSFNPKKRNIKQIKFIIFHYTGMKRESEAINRLTNAQSEVSCHYLIKKNGKIIKLVPDLYIAWHAGKSKWKGYSNLNDHSIGIELENRGHDYGYQNFTIVQYKSLNSLISSLCKSFRIQKNDILGHSDIAPNRKIDPGEKFKWNLIK